LAKEGGAAEEEEREGGVGTGQREVDQWAAEIADHEAKMQAAGKGEGEVDLEEAAGLLDAIEGDSDLIMSGRQLRDDDDSWAAGRDAASGGLSEAEDEAGGRDTASGPINNADERTAKEGGLTDTEASVENGSGTVEDLGMDQGDSPEAVVRSIGLSGRDRKDDRASSPQQPRWDESLVQAARDMGFVAETAHFLAGYQAERLAPENDEHLAEVIPLSPRTGRQAAAEHRTATDSHSGSSADTEEAFMGTPEGGRDYPRDLLAAMDFLAEHVGGDTGHLAALVLADEFEVTGQVPLGLPPEVDTDVREALQRYVAGE
jgi:hypothetical protein